MFITVSKHSNAESWNKGEAVIASIRVWTNIQDLLLSLKEHYKLVSGMYSDFETYLSIRSNVYYVSTNTNTAPTIISGSDLVDMARTLKIT